MNIQSESQGEALVVSVIGSIDALTAEEITRHMAGEVERGNVRLVADLSGVEFMSSAGLRAILATLKRCRNAGGDLRLAGPQPGVERVLKMSGFVSILKVFASRADAVASFAV